MVELICLDLVDIKLNPKYYNTIYKFKAELCEKSLTNLFKLIKTAFSDNAYNIFLI